MGTSSRRQRKRPESQTKPLSREAIVEAALARIDTVGLDGFSLREVARDLGVYPTALYWHVPGGRNGLLAAVAAAAMEDVAPAIGGADDWRDWLRLLFRGYRSALHRHPNVAPLLGAQLVSNAGVDPVLVERVLGVLEQAGFADDALVDAYNAVIAGMLGFVTLELAPMPGDDPAGWAQALRQQFEDIPAGAFPVLARHRERLADRAFIVRWTSGSTRPLDGGFRIFTEALITGLDAMRPRCQKPRTRAASAPPKID